MATSVFAKPYDFYVKADGVAGQDCDFTTLAAALGSNRSILILKPTIYSVTLPNTAAAGTMTIPLPAGHGFVNGDVVAIESDVASSNYVEGVFPVTNVTSVSVDVTLRSQPGDGATGTGYTGGAARLWKCINGQVDLSGVKNMVVEGQSRRFCTLTSMSTASVVVVTNSAVVESVRFQNIRICVNTDLPSTAVMISIGSGFTGVSLTNITFRHCILGSFDNGYQNGGVYARLFDVRPSSSTSFTRNFTIDDCLITGRATTAGGSSILFFGNGNNSGEVTGVRIINNNFRQMNKIAVDIFGKITGMQVQNNQFHDQQHTCIFVNGTGGTALVTSLVITNNTMLALGGGVAAASGKNGINIAGDVQGVVIGNNRITGMDNGIAITTTTSTKIIVTGNLISSCLTDGIVTTNGDIVTVTGNICDNNASRGFNGGACNRLNVIGNVFRTNTVANYLASSGTNTNDGDSAQENVIA